MRRGVVLLVVTATLVVAFAGVAVALNVVRCEGRAPCDGTDRADLVTGDASDNNMYGLGGSDTIRGLAGRDILDGGASRDVLEGAGQGAGQGDFLEGGLGNDTLVGGRGADEFIYYSNGWGRDTVEDSDAPNPQELAPNQLFFLPETPLNLIIDLESGPGPEARNAAGTATIEWEDDAIGAAQLGAPGTTRNRLYGNAADNLLAVGIREPGRGEDVVWGRGGDDDIYAGDGEGDDVVSCGDGQDVVYRDPGDTIAEDCEVQQDPPFRPAGTVTLGP
jgi:Ca2+-binding RTX toxin-like protein